MRSVGLTSRQSGHDNIRNITSHPWSGIDPEELLDTRELARHIQAMIIGNREFSDLPRKFNIALTGRAEARSPRLDPGSSVMSPRVVPMAPSVSNCCWVATRGRHRTWPGTSRCSCGQSRCWASLRLPCGRSASSGTAITAIRCAFAISSNGLALTRYCSRSSSVWATNSSVFPSHHPAQRRKKISLAGFKQKQPDLWAVGVCVPVGRLTWDQFEGLAVIARQYGDGTLRTTYDQNLVLPGMPATVTASCRLRSGAARPDLRAGCL